MTLHELSHELARINGGARGGAPSEFADGGPLTYLRMPGESSHDAYLRMLDDVHQVTRSLGGEVLFFCSDDRSTRPGEEEAEERIRSNGVRFRCLIEAGNNFTRWPRKEYRVIPKDYFNHDLQVIYGDKVAQMINGGEKILIVHNASLATTARNVFNLLWSLMRPLPKGKGDHE